MAKGVIYVMTCVVPGLVKIGKTGTDNYEKRMYNLEHDGYRNVTGMKREFAIEVEEYDAKEALLHTIFEKSRVGDTELFALDIEIVKKLLLSFDGRLIYPKDETKTEMFAGIVEDDSSEIIKNGVYYFKKTKKADNKKRSAVAVINGGKWILKKGSTLAIFENTGMSSKAKAVRHTMEDKKIIDKDGKLLYDFELGKCSPSFAGSVVMYSAIDGWIDWKDENGQPVDIYRQIAQKSQAQDDED